eukprot:CAMPEP_0194044720 /NCGR_PEP_ID=MMETSP0009_2-20130614/16141_1 /TAXON_ID=210454 /ORGANISM="Grammatophora oceanica, Strain CCMP 410" /LENGTH=161 /DNA_ID=CAMNT_0038689315 /DNA_START=230 /DNA_END=715 /DNA_ORIENTATION=+
MTTLHFFPGKPWGIAYGRNVFDGEQENKSENSADSVEPRLDPASENHEKEPPHQAGDDPQTWVGDEIPKEILDRVRKRNGLTEEQMAQVIRNARGQALRQTPQPAKAHRQWDAYVYLVCFALLVYFVNRDYNDFASWWFAWWFPKEARTLGLFVPEAIEND